MAVVVLEMKKRQYHSKICKKRSLLMYSQGWEFRNKNLGIPFRTLSGKRKQLGIPFRGTKINPSAVENTTRNSVPWNQNRCKILGIMFRTIPQKRRQLGIPFRATKIEIYSVPSVEEKPTQKSEQNAAAKYFNNSVRKDDF